MAQNKANFWEGQYEGNMILHNIDVLSIIIIIIIIIIIYCQRASRAKTRGWWGGSIIEPCESIV